MMLLSTAASQILMLLLQGTTYRCRKCRRLLATQRNVVPVEAGAGPSAFPFRKRRCAYFQDTEDLPSRAALSRAVSMVAHVALQHFRKRFSNAPSDKHRSRAHCMVLLTSEKAPES